MIGKEIKLLITDFDGTLVDTFEANLKAYQIAFKQCNLHLDTQIYRKYFGLRFDTFIK
jgi:beta-phosphoglucomutase-like phosphatase (HAD superfamily)